jgi:hypothetical protein
VRFGGGTGIQQRAQRATLHGGLRMGCNQANPSPCDPQVRCPLQPRDAPHRNLVYARSRKYTNNLAVLRKNPVR